MLLVIGFIFIAGIVGLYFISNAEFLSYFKYKEVGKWERGREDLSISLVSFRDDLPPFYVPT